MDAASCRVAAAGSRCHFFAGFRQNISKEALKHEFSEVWQSRSELTCITGTQLKALREIAQTFATMTPATPPPEGLLAGLPAVDAAGEHGEIELRQCAKCKQGYLSGYAKIPRSDGKCLDKSAVFENHICSPQLLVTMRKPAGAPAPDDDKPYNDPAPKLNLPG